MQPTVNEIADGIYRISTFVPEVGPDGFTFNQFLVDDDEPLLFHTGPRGMFPLVAEAVASRHAGRAAALDHVRSRRVRRVRLDERCGSPRRPTAQVAHGATRLRWSR